MSELKSCKCGGKAALNAKCLWEGGGWGKSYWSYHGECTKCGLTGEHFNTIDHVNARQQAIDAWNRRVGCEPAGECAERGSWCGEEGEKG